MKRKGIERKKMERKNISFEEMKQLILYHYITEWNNNTITLDNGLKIAIEETEQDCCASASGDFSEVILDAAITSVTEPKYRPWDDGDTYGCKAVVRFMHNRNLVCKASANADAGNGGYYYSIASFVLSWNNEQMVCHFVGSEDK